MSKSFINSKGYETTTKEAFHSLPKDTDSKNKIDSPSSSASSAKCSQARTPRSAAGKTKNSKERRSHSQAMEHYETSSATGDHGSQKERRLPNTEEQARASLPLKDLEVTEDPGFDFSFCAFTNFCIAYLLLGDENKCDECDKPIQWSDAQMVLETKGRQVYFHKECFDFHREIEREYGSMSLALERPISELTSKSKKNGNPKDDMVCEMDDINSTFMFRGRISRIKKPEESAGDSGSSKDFLKSAFRFRRSNSKGRKIEDPTESQPSTGHTKSGLKSKQEPQKQASNDPTKTTTMLKRVFTRSKSSKQGREEAPAPLDVLNMEQITEATVSTLSPIPVPGDNFFRLKGEKGRAQGIRSFSNPRSGRRRPMLNNDHTWRAVAPVEFIEVDQTNGSRISSVNDASNNIDSRDDDPKHRENETSGERIDVESNTFKNSEQKENRKPVQKRRLKKNNENLPSKDIFEEIIDASTSMVDILNRNISYDSRETDSRETGSTESSESSSDPESNQKSKDSSLTKMLKDPSTYLMSVIFTEHICVHCKKPIANAETTKVVCDGDDEKSYYHRECFDNRKESLKAWAKDYTSQKSKVRRKKE